MVALAGDPDATDYSVECNARALGSGTFGLVVRHTGPQSYLSLELTPGAGRTAHLALGRRRGRFGLVRTLWEDAGRSSRAATTR